MDVNETRAGTEGNETGRGRLERGDSEVPREASGLKKVLKVAQLDGCFTNRHAEGPKKGEEMKTIRLAAPPARKFAEEQVQQGFPPRKTNLVVTSKYTIWSFFPLAFAYQFRRFVNAFFAVIVILLLIGNLKPNIFLAPWEATGTFVYLMILVCAGLVVEGSDDLAKHRGDKEENNRKIERLDWKSGKLVESRWGDLIPGDIVVVNDRENFPADVVVLYGTANEERNMCYVETSGIDGETNLKIKDVPEVLVNAVGGEEFASEFELPRFSVAEKHRAAEILSKVARGVYEYEQPNVFLQFNGSFASDMDNGNKTPLFFKNLVLRGSSLRNTKFVLGLVVYAGHETKLAMSRQPSPNKFSTIDRIINRTLTALLVLYLILVVIADVLFATVNTRVGSDSFWYLGVSTTKLFVLPVWLSYFFTFCILFSALIPLPMVLLNEILNKYFQRRVYDDMEMYHEETDTRALCRAAALTAEVGQVTHFFSDKTGTLTRNEMKLVSLWLPTGAKYGVRPAPLPQEDTEGPGLEDAAAMTSAGKVEHPVDAVAPAPRDLSTREVFEDLLEDLKLPAEKRGQDARLALDLLVFLASCHTVLLDRDAETGTVSLNSESPDEEAFVKGARDLGVTLLDSSNGRMKVQLPSGDSVVYRVLAVNPFNSARKRMSMVAQREDDSLVVMMKGADNVMLERLAPGQDKQVEAMKSDLNLYAWSGLRTLVMGQRSLTEEEFLGWENSFKEAMVAPSAQREDALARAAERLEVGMSLVGATAIEDQLQLGVPQAIQSLRDAGIQVWVLTGDKMETAINIGLSSRLLDSDMYQLKLVSKDPEVLEQQLDESLAVLGDAAKHSGSSDSRNNNNDDDGDLESGRAPAPEAAEQAGLKQHVASNFIALVVSGESLELILHSQKGSDAREKKFLKVARACKVVLACRVSPKQKALIVELVRFAKDNHKLPVVPKTLAIGDGANDVPMIQAAHVGVGISGHEGRQAVNSSDFAIAQFRFVVRLCLVHGRWNYRRQAVLVNFLIYSWMVYVGLLYLYGPYCLWSGQQIYFFYIYTFFAAPLLNWSILYVALANKDLSDKFALQNPWVYEVGMHNHDLDLRVAGFWVLRALFNVAIIYACVFRTFPLSISSEVMGSTVYTTVIYVVNFQACFSCLTFNRISYLGVLFIFVAFPIGMAIVTTPPFIFSSVAGAGFAWAQVFVALFATIALEALIKYVSTEFFTSPLQLLMEQAWASESVKSGALAVVKDSALFAIRPVMLGKNAVRNAVNRRKANKSKTPGVFKMEPPGTPIDFVEGQETGGGLAASGKNAADDSPASRRRLSSTASSSRSLGSRMHLQAYVPSSRSLAADQHE